PPPSGGRHAPGRTGWRPPAGYRAWYSSLPPERAAQKSGPTRVPHSSGAVQSRGEDLDRLDADAEMRRRVGRELSVGVDRTPAARAHADFGRAKGANVVPATLGPASEARQQSEQPPPVVDL